MPEGCLVKECRECEWQVTKDIKLDCNYGNRLGLAEPVLGAFATKETDKEVLKKKLEAKEKELEEIKEALKEGSGEAKKEEVKEDVSVS